MSPLSGVLTEAWDLYRRFAGHFLLISFAIYVIAALLIALLSLIGVIGAIIGIIVSLVATYLVQASLIKAVQDVRDGRVDLDLGQTVQAAVPFILPVIGASILAGIGIAVGFILLIVPGLILLTFWCLIVPFIVLAGSGVFEAFGNSMRTVRGYAWRVFGTYVLVFLILIAFGIVLGLILSVLHSLFLRSFLNNVISGTLIAPFLALVATLIYYRLTAAHAGQPYNPTGPAGAAVAEPPYPTVPGTTAPWATGPTAPGPNEPWSTGPTAPGQAEPWSTGSTEPSPTEPWPVNPPDQGPDAPPPPSTP